MDTHHTPMSRMSILTAVRCGATLTSSVTLHTGSDLSLPAAPGNTGGLETGQAGGDGGEAAAPSFAATLWSSSMPFLLSAEY